MSATLPSLDLPRGRRLRRTADFGRIERQGIRASGAFVAALSKRGGGRVGFTVSKKVGNAVARNWVKRRLREVARKHQALWRAHDLVIVAKPEAAWRSFDELERDVLMVLGKLRERADGNAKR